MWRAPRVRLTVRFPLLPLSAAPWDTRIQYSRVGFLCRPRARRCAGGGGLGSRRPTPPLGRPLGAPAGRRPPRLQRLSPSLNARCAVCAAAVSATMMALLGARRDSSWPDQEATRPRGGAPYVFCEAHLTDGARLAYVGLPGAAARWSPGTAARAGVAVVVTRVFLRKFRDAPRSGARWRLAVWPFFACAARRAIWIWLRATC